jgi:hypothetical protein
VAASLPPGEGVFREITERGYDAAATVIPQDAAALAGDTLAARAPTSLPDSRTAPLSFVRHSAGHNDDLTRACRACEFR